MYVCMHACMYACMYAWMYVCMYKCMHAWNYELHYVRKCRKKMKSSWDWKPSKTERGGVGTEIISRNVWGYPPLKFQGIGRGYVYIYIHHRIHIVNPFMVTLGWPIVKPRHSTTLPLGQRTQQVLLSWIHCEMHSKWYLDLSSKEQCYKIVVRI